MENAFKYKFDLSIDEFKNNDKNIENQSSNICGHNDSVVSKNVSSSVQSKFFENIKHMANDSEEKNEKSSKTSSVLDPYCKTNILDESDDFIFCEPMNKLKNDKNESVTKSSKNEVISCEICKEDLMPLDVYSRAVHVNNCIDKQIPPEPEVQISRNENIFILECPLCFKHISSPELRAKHIKKCGKSKGLSIQSVIKALELQERHALERITLGLPAKPLKPVKSHKTTVSKRAVVEPKNKAQSDIQLAKALSLSLTNSGKQSEEENKDIKFGTLKLPDNHHYPGTKSKSVINTPLLVLRTEEERNKLLLDRVATIVAPLNSCENSPGAAERDSSHKKDENRSVPPLLWQLSGKALEKYEYYIESLLDWVQPSDVEVGAKLGHLSQIAGHEIVTQLPCDYTFVSKETKERSCMEFTDEQASPPSLIGSLRSLVASSWMSDVDIYTACGSVIPAHKLLLAVRCPLLKQDSDFCSKNDRVSLKWETTSFNVALQFLNFIYTGTYEIEENMKSDMLYLANRYEVSELQTLLLLNPKMNTQSEIESKEKISDENGYKDLTFPLLSSSLNKVLEYEHSPVSETEGCDNMDLEIVHNCINSSMKPSQASMNECLSPTTSPQSASKTNSAHLSDICDEYVSLAQSSNQCSIYNCALPAHNSSTSPEIFDVSDSDRENEMDVNSDNESVEFPANCSQNSVLQECNLVEKELDLCSIESNSSHDSVKFLESSFPNQDSLSKTPIKEKSSFISTSPLPNYLLGGESPSPISDVSRDSQKSNAKWSAQKTDASGSKEFLRHGHVSFYSPATPPIKCSFSQYKAKIQANNEINLKEVSVVSPFDKNAIINLISEPELAERVTFDSISSKLSHPMSLETGSDLGGGVIPVRDFPGNKSSMFSSAKNVTASSPEMPIYDFERDLKSPGNIPCIRYASCKKADDIFHGQIESHFNDVGLTGKNPNFFLNCQDKEDFQEKTSKNEVYVCSPTSNILPNAISHDFPERKKTMSLDVLCTTSDSVGPSNLSGYSFLGNEKCELKKKSSLSASPSEEVGSSKQENYSGSPQIPHKSFGDPQYECNEYFEHRFLSSQKTNSSRSYSSRTTNFSEDNQFTKSATPGSSTEPQFKMTDSPVTPFPDYKNMVTPEIKQALRKIGVKALSRKKAVDLLSHVYNETHPLINGEINTESCFPEKTLRMNKLKRPKKLGENTAKRAKKQKTEIQRTEDINEAQDINDSPSKNSEWEGCIPEISFSQLTQDSPSKSSADDIDHIKQYIQSNEEIYNNILTYLPLNLVTFHQELKDSGIRISIQKLMDFLDEQCITFTCPRKEEYRKKQTARAQRFRKNMIAKFSQQTT